MKYTSTRNKEISCKASAAIAQGLSKEGGLLTPDKFPHIGLEGIESLVSMNYQQRAVEVMHLFLEDFSKEELAEFAAKAYGPAQFSNSSIAPVKSLDSNTYCMELWHGPTCAFKDMALQMLPHLLSASLVKNQEEKTACILVATSGDTGKAALEGFKDVEQTEILVFYPEGGVSEVQKLQMQTQEGCNVNVCSVVGNFDDAQTGVKRLFADRELQSKLADRGYFFSSANSINWGRILPQIIYYVSAYCDLIAQGSIVLGDPINFSVPTGNFGNILSAYYAKLLGVPVNKLICASNQNNVLTDFIQTGVYDRNRPFYATMSPSMDILISSNLERMLFAFSDQDDQLVASYMECLNQTGTYQVSEAIKKRVNAQFASGYCSDADTQTMVAKMWNENGYLIDTHTAIAFHVLEKYREETADKTPTVVVSTASPFKFCDDVLSALGEVNVKSGTESLVQLADLTGETIPSPLATLKDKEVRFTDGTTKEDMVNRVLEMLQ